MCVFKPGQDNFSDSFLTWSHRITPESLLKCENPAALCLQSHLTCSLWSEFPSSFCSGHRNSFVWQDVGQWEEYVPQRGVNTNMLYCRWKRPWAAQCYHSVHRDVSLPSICFVFGFLSHWILLHISPEGSAVSSLFQKRWVCISLLNSVYFLKQCHKLFNQFWEPVRVYENT